jgi:hypothetical protein
VLCQQQQLHTCTIFSGMVSASSSEEYPSKSKKFFAILLLLLPMY